MMTRSSSIFVLPFLTLISLKTSSERSFLRTISCITGALKGSTAVVRYWKTAKASWGDIATRRSLTEIFEI